MNSSYFTAIQESVFYFFHCYFFFIFFKKHHNNASYIYEHVQVFRLQQYCRSDVNYILSDILCSSHLI